MKVGTDGILLGAWAPIARLKRAGYRRGQRSAGANARSEPAMVMWMRWNWMKRRQRRREKTPFSVGCAADSSGGYSAVAAAQTRRYELIVSNPPFLPKACLAPPRSASRRGIPRRSITHAINLRRSLLPKRAFSAWCCRWILVMRLCSGQNMGWHLRLRTDVAETEMRPPHRVLLAFSPTAGSV
jgi:tRNA1Val (adenine37-N6)-methyltransferase